MATLSTRDDEWKGEERRENPSVHAETLAYPARATERRRSFLKYRAFSPLKKKLLIYFLAVGFISLIVGLEMIWEIGEPKLIGQLSESVDAAFPDQTLDPALLAGAFQPLHDLQTRMLLLLSIVGLCVLIALGVFVREIADPLDGMVTAAKQIREGHLDVTVPVCSKDEIGQLGEIFNDLTVNFQEVLLFVGAVNGDLNHVVEKINDNRPDPDEGNEMLHEQLDLMTEKIDEMKEMVRSFDFYHVNFDGDHVTGNEPDEILEKFKNLT